MHKNDHRIRSAFDLLSSLGSVVHETSSPETVPDAFTAWSAVRRHPCGPEVEVARFLGDSECLKCFDFPAYPRKDNC